MSREHWWNGTSKGKPKYSGRKGVKVIPVSRVQQKSHLNSPGVHGESIATNGLSHGTAFR